MTHRVQLNYVDFSGNLHSLLALNARTVNENLNYLQKKVGYFLHSSFELNQQQRKECCLGPEDVGCLDSYASTALCSTR